MGFSPKFPERLPGFHSEGQMTKLRLRPPRVESTEYRTIPVCAGKAARLCTVRALKGLYCPFSLPALPPSVTTMEALRYKHLYSTFWRGLFCISGKIAAST